MGKNVCGLGPGSKCDAEDGDADDAMQEQEEEGEQGTETDQGLTETGTCLTVSDDFKEGRIWINHVREMCTARVPGTSWICYITFPYLILFRYDMISYDMI